MSIILQSSGGGSVTIAEPTTASNFTQTLPAATGNVILDSTAGVCRAWVNFNGTGTVAIRASFNVSSITDNGTGDYTVNFTTAMPDANYSLVTMSNKAGTGDSIRCCNFITDLASPAVGSCRISHAFVTGTPIDSSIITVAVFR
jgi:hypothetical protein